MTVTQPPATLTFQLKNQVPPGFTNVYAFITGRAIDQNSAITLLKSDGKTIFNPVIPYSATPVLLDSNYGNFAINLGKAGNLTTVTVPRLNSARIYFSIDKKLNFYIVGDPNHVDRNGNSAPIPLGLVEPTVVSSGADPSNYDTQWSFCEFAFNTTELFANITYVDFISLPIALDLTTKSAPSSPQRVPGLASNSITSIASALNAQTLKDKRPWSSLIVQDANGRILRILGPDKASGLIDDIHHQPAVHFGDYYQQYVDNVWATFTYPKKITVNTQNGGYGADIVGYTQSDQAPIIFYGPGFTGGQWSFPKPNADDIFSCSTGPFSTVNDIRGNVSARMGAAFNRTTLLPEVQDNTVQPNGPLQSTYYGHDPTNHYARILHQTSLLGIGYAFPYDDVQADNAPFLGGKVEASDPDQFIVTVGGNQNDPPAVAKKEF